MLNRQIIIRPIISEKSLNRAALSWYTFEVDLKAKKMTIKKAVNEAFKVKVLEIKTMIVKGKTGKFGKKRKESKKSNWKKAMVRLAPEQKIELFNVPTGEKAKA